MKVEDIKRIAVVGAGLMGHGIAQEFALAGYEVSLNDLTDEMLKQALRDIRRNLKMLAEMGLIARDRIEPALNKIQVNTLLEELVSDVDVVIEAVFEDLAIKQQVFRELDKHCPEHTILASNSSSLMPSQMASATSRPDKVLVTHYYNPPYLLPLVEVVKSPLTSDETVQTIYELMKKAGKTPVILRKEALGFIGNRLQFALVREAFSIVEKGIASPEDIDVVIKNSFGRRLSVAGLFEIFDIAGWDLGVPVYSYIVPDLETSKDLPRLLKEKVERGELGVKTRKGFYEYTPESAEALRRRVAGALLEIAKWS
jgi:3-hydroxybutyryl-CoA dehydrogenase